MMTLGELIAALEREPPDKTVAHGFGAPHSCRGFYDELAFEPAANMTVGSMLAHARGALGKTFTGYKGGDYVMDQHTPVWLASWGHSDGEEITTYGLAFMLARESL